MQEGRKKRKERQERTEEKERKNEKREQLRCKEGVVGYSIVVVYYGIVNIIYVTSVSNTSFCINCE